MPSAGSSPTGDRATARSPTARLEGGFTTEAPPAPGGPLVILYAADLAGTQARVESAGGNIVKPIFEFPGGRRFHFADPDGYELAVWSDK